MSNTTKPRQFPVRCHKLPTRLCAYREKNGISFWHLLEKEAEIGMLLALEQVNIAYADPKKAHIFLYRSDAVEGDKPFCKMDRLTFKTCFVPQPGYQKGKAA